MTDKILSWRSSRLHRKCRYCKYLCHINTPVDGGFYKCAAKAKPIRDLFPDMTSIHRPFCSLFEVEGERDEPR